jgi:hypothetical protein
MNWFSALKEYNSGKAWSVPRKGSKEYDEVKAIMNKASSEPPSATPTTRAVSEGTPKVASLKTPRTRKPKVDTQEQVSNIQESISHTEIAGKPSEKVVNKEMVSEMADGKTKKKKKLRIKIKEVLTENELKTQQTEVKK